MAKFDVEYESSVDTSTVAILDSLTDSSVTWTELHEAIKIIPDRTKIVIRSTVGPNNLEDKWIHWPEFLRENNWEEDSDDKSIPFIIGADGATQSEMESWFTNRKTIFVSPKTAAVYKLSRNAMLAAKVTMANYIHKVCVEQNIEYNNVSSLLKEHANLGTSHWDVPGPDGEYGLSLIHI